MGWFWNSSTAAPEAKPAEPLPHPSAPSGTPATAAVCPVDHTTRQAWLEKARAQRDAEAASKPAPPASIPAGESCDSSKMDQSLPANHPPLPTGARLGTSREISTIPRAVSEESASLANNEQETGADKKTGNWIYPSEQMFFNAMRRKNYDPKEADMRTIVPIHNAVNERAWKEIKDWEKGRGSESCGGPKLVSFSGMATALTPRARFNTFLGYQPPFDRHDWVVDRCGQQVEYVIDFYSGKDEGKPGKSLSFYLDVRPKLNSWEGCKMRMQRFVGL